MDSTSQARPRYHIMLIIDAVINFMLGVLLMLFPHAVVSYLGLPMSYEPFYTSLLGAVLFGIAIALVIEYVQAPEKLTGLGIGGAVAINVSGACVIMLWLVSGQLVIPLRGYLVLWIVVFVLLIVSGIELIVWDGSINKKEKSANKDSPVHEGEAEVQGEDN